MKNENRSNGHLRPTPSPLQQSLDIREAIRAEFTPTVVTQIVKTLIERALQGDVRAIQLVLDRAIGQAPLPEWKPRNQVEESAKLDELLRIPGVSP